MTMGLHSDEAAARELSSGNKVRHSSQDVRATDPGTTPRHTVRPLASYCTVDIRHLVFLGMRRTPPGGVISYPFIYLISYLSIFVNHLEQLKCAQWPPSDSFSYSTTCLYFVFTEGQIIHLYNSRHLRAAWIFKALMFGRLMQLPKQLAITGLSEILPAPFSPISATIKHLFEASLSLPFWKVFSVDNDLFQFTPQPLECCANLIFSLLKAWVPAVLWHEFNHEPLVWAHMADLARQQLFHLCG